MQYDALLGEVRAGLEQGRIAPAQVERLVRRSRGRSEDRPDASGVLKAAGLVVAFAGLAMLYATGYSGYSTQIREVTPFAFPLAAIALAVALGRACRPRWQVESAGLVGYTAYALAALATGAAANAGSGFVVVAAAAGAVLALLMHRWVRSLRLTAWGVSTGAAVCIAVEAVRLSLVSSDHLQWVLLPEAVLLAVAAGLLLPRAHAAAAAAARTAALVGIIAAMYGMGSSGWSRISAWDAVLVCVVALALVAAAAFDLGGLLAIGNLGGVLWLIAVADVVRGSADWSVAVVLAGAGIVGLGFLTHWIRERRRPVPALADP